VTNRWERRYPGSDVEEKVQEPAVVARARQGDASAWEELYRRAYPGLLAYARRRLDAESARDAVSETMARAVSSIDRFAWNGVGFDAWLFGILRHVVIDAQRALTERAIPADVSPDSPGPLDHLLGAEEAKAVRAAFRRLGEADQEVLELRVVAQLSADEVGEVLGKKPGAVRMAQARALERLRALMEEGS
jgi:RNA polymerase sigma-70 factor (ECF subfamily)